MNEKLTMLVLWLAIVGLAACAAPMPPSDETGSSSTGDKSVAQRAGESDFDATGRIPCAQYSGQPMGQCDFGVVREGGGTAAVVVTRTDGTTRALFFVDGAFNSADTSQADGYPEYSASREGDLNMIRVGEERYEIPDAVIYGG